MMRFFSRFNQPLKHSLDHPCPMFEKMKKFFSREVGSIDNHAKKFLDQLKRASTAREFMRQFNSPQGVKLVERSPDLHRLLSEEKAMPPNANLIALEKAVEKLDQSAAKFQKR